MNAEVVTVLEHLSLAYGPRFTRQFGAADPAAVQAAWAKQLAGLTPRAIEQALLHLPDKPPNAVEFHALCVAARPRPTQAQKPQGEPTTAPPEAQSVSATLGRRAARGPRQWAIDLKAQELRDPTSLSRFQRRCWREALGEPWEDCA